MSTYIKPIEDKDGNTVLPITKTQAIYDEQGNRLDNTLENVENKIGTLTEGLTQVSNLTNQLKANTRIFGGNANSSLEDAILQNVNAAKTTLTSGDWGTFSGGISYKNSKGIDMVGYVDYWLNGDGFVTGTMTPLATSDEPCVRFISLNGGASIEIIPFSKCVKGEFTAAPNTDGLVEIELGFKPTRVECWFSFNNVGKETLGNQMCAYYDATLSTTQSMWNLHPAESAIYYLDLNASSSETGISHITNTGFKFRAHGGNTTNTKVRYIAY